ncbi:MAG: acyl-CoA thioesterase [Spirochaetales bacterium]|nr:acyl-CoA thioesterase [Spirochaetales bacterium]
MDYIFEIDMEVRDHECDVQGVVNNGQYQNYMSHARHKFIKSEGVDFNKLYKEGIAAMVTRVEMDYLAPLLPNEEFTVKIALERKKSTRLIFLQDIFKKDGTQVIRAQVTTVCIDLKEGFPLRLDEVFEPLFTKYGL